MSQIPYDPQLPTPDNSQCKQISVNKHYIKIQEKGSVYLAVDMSSSVFFIEVQKEEGKEGQMHLV